MLIHFLLVILWKHEVSFSFCIIVFCPSAGISGRTSPTFKLDSIKFGLWPWGYRFFFLFTMNLSSDITSFVCFVTMIRWPSGANVIIRYIYIYITAQCNVKYVIHSVGIVLDMKHLLGKKIGFIVIEQCFRASKQKNNHLLCFHTKKKRMKMSLSWVWCGAGTTSELRILY